MGPSPSQAYVFYTAADGQNLALRQGPSAVSSLLCAMHSIVHEQWFPEHVYYGLYRVLTSRRSLAGW